MPLADYNSLSADIISDISSTTADPSASATSADSGQSSAFGMDTPIKYRASGRDLEEPLSAVIQRAQRGYDYAQLVEKHKQRETSLTEKEKSLQDFAKQWQPYVDYANQNPQWADHVRSSWESAANPTAQPLNAAAAPNGELQEIKSFIENYKQERVLAQQAQEDSALSVQVEDVRKAHPEIDFGASDPATGETLEFKILKHGETNGILSFRAAFRDYYHDHLIEKASLKAKETVAQTIQQKAKTGHLFESSTSTMNPQQQQDAPKRRNYFDAIMDGLKEIRN